MKKESSSKRNNNFAAIECENDLCIYNAKRKCDLDTIRISPLGICEEYITPTIDEETLERYKSEQRKALESEQRKTLESNHLDS